MAIEILRPSAAGDEESVDFSVSGAGNHWQDVDDEISDSLTTCIYTHINSYKRDLYTIPAATGSGIINSLKVFFRVQEVGYAKPSIKCNGVVVDGTEVAIPASWGLYSQTWTLNPNDSKPFEWADIATLQIGVSLKGNGTFSAYCTQVYAIINYTPYRIKPTIIIKNPAGDTLHYLPHASAIGYDYRVNELGLLSFKVPADDPARAHLIFPNEAWLYVDGVLQDIFKITLYEGAR